MIVGKHFPGDDNRVLMEIQFDTYMKPGGVGLLCAEAERRYAAAIRLLSVTTDLWQAIKQHDERYYPWRKRTNSSLFINSFDHRVLAHAYDTIAAAFRFHNSDLWLPLFPKDDAVRLINMEAWEKYWPREVKRLVQDDQIAVAVLTAVASQNEKQGTEAEREQKQLLSREYEIASSVMDQWSSQRFNV